MADFSDSFEMITDTDLWIQAVVVFGAFLAPTVLNNVLGGMVPDMVPDEAYGVAVIVLAQFLPEYTWAASLGGGLYSVDKVAERFDLKQEVENVGGS